MRKQLILMPCLLCFFIYTHLTADSTYWDSSIVRAYVHNSDLQRRWAWSFLAPSLCQLRGDEQILDIGCGDGKITADISRFVPRGGVLGIDPSKSMIEWAVKQYCSKEYPNLSFQEGGFLEPNTSDRYDLIISNCALQHCLDKHEALNNIAGLLKPDGKLLVTVPVIDNSAWREARKTIQTSSKWAVYWEHTSPISFLGCEDYRKLLQEASFLPLRIEKISTTDPFVDREEFLHFCLGTFPPVVPRSLATEFYNEIIDEYIRLSPSVLQQNGVLEARFGRIEIEAKIFITP